MMKRWMAIKIGVSRNARIAASTSVIAVPNSSWSARRAGMNWSSTEIARTMRKTFMTSGRSAASMRRHSRYEAPSVGQIGNLC
jgi:nicotinamide mononucleotide (NMN) deamidase PncC